MLRTKISLWIAVPALAGWLAAPAFAQGSATFTTTVPGQPVRVTFDAPVTLPGVTLPKGTYEFRIDPTRGGQRQLVKVFDVDTGKMMTQQFAIQALRSSPTKKAEVTFLETPANTPPAVKTWWYPGIREGHEFVYPRKQAEQFAKMNEQGVLTTKSGESTESGNLTRLSPSGERPVTSEENAANESQPANAKTSQANAQPSEANASAGQASASAQASVTPADHENASASMSGSAAANTNANTNVNRQPRQMAQNNAAESGNNATMQSRNTSNSQRQALPQTASDLPLILAAGFLSLFAGLALRKRGMAIGR